MTSFGITSKFPEFLQQLQIYPFLISGITLIHKFWCAQLPNTYIIAVL